MLYHPGGVFILLRNNLISFILDRYLRFYQKEILHHFALKEFLE